MGFNFGAFLGGAASQIVEDIDEQEKEISYVLEVYLIDKLQKLWKIEKSFRTIKRK